MVKKFISTLKNTSNCKLLFGENEGCHFFLQKFYVIYSCYAQRQKEVQGTGPLVGVSEGGQSRSLFVPYTANMS